jgi:hypothetical protein
VLRVLPAMMEMEVAKAAVMVVTTIEIKGKM